MSDTTSTMMSRITSILPVLTRVQEIVSTPAPTERPALIKYMTNIVGELTEMYSMLAADLPEEALEDFYDSIEELRAGIDSADTCDDDAFAELLMEIESERLLMWDSFNALCSTLTELGRAQAAFEATVNDMESAWGL